MWTLVIAMLVILVLAGAVVLYVAFPHRGEDVPAAAWLGRLMHRGVQAAPTIDDDHHESHASSGIDVARPESREH